MRLNLAQLKRDNVIRASYIVSVVFFLILLVLILLFQSRLPPLLPLLNNMPWGTQRLLDKNIIFLIPVIIIFVGTINTIVVASLYNKNILLARIMSFNTLLFNLLALLAIIQIILLML